MRKAILFILLFISILGSAQERKNYLAEYKGKANYAEVNHFMADSMWRFAQIIAYDDPNSIDEETWTQLFIVIKDTNLFLRKRSIDIEKDHQAVNCYFSEMSNWGYSRDTTSVSGRIELLNITNDGVAIRMDLTVTNKKTKAQHIYIGERLFNRKTTVREFYAY